MRVFLLLALAACVSAFQPTFQTKKASMTELSAVVGRREIMAGIAGAFFLAPTVSHAADQSTSGSTWFFDENIENVRVESQMNTGGKLDLNSASVVRSQ